MIMRHLGVGDPGHDATRHYTILQHTQPELLLMTHRNSASDKTLAEYIRDHPLATAPLGHSSAYPIAVSVSSKGYRTMEMFSVVDLLS